MGYHYTMGAKCITTKLSKIKDAEASRAPSRNRTRITSLRRRSLAVRPSVPVSKCFSGTGENRTHIVRFKRPMHYLVCHNPICSRCFVSVVVSFQSAWRELNPRPSPYKDAALTPELHADASPMGPKGVEPSPNGVKVRHAASYTTAPMFNRGYAFPLSLHFKPFSSMFQFQKW